MKGLGTNERMIIDNLGDKTPGDMKMIQASYKDQFTRDFITDIKDECGGKFLDVLVALCTDPADWDAHLVRKAVGGLGTDESLLSEVLCTRTPGELKAAAASYQRIFNRNMEADIKSDVSGDLGRVYACVFSPARGTRTGNAAADVEALFKAGAGKLGTDENSFINIIASSSKDYAEALFYEYAKKHGKSLDVVIRDEMGDDAGKALAQLATPPHVLFADKIRKTMDGMGTNDEKLIRLLTTQRGRNLKAAGKHFLEVNRKTISAAVTEETSGDYRDILVKMCTAEGV
jgi:annexin A7/11